MACAMRSTRACAARSLSGESYSISPTHHSHIFQLADPAPPLGLDLDRCALAQKKIHQHPIENIRLIQKREMVGAAQLEHLERAILLAQQIGLLVADDAVV